ncbi:NAD(P)-binding protein [Hymenopellis radicata]|nr:NAD(P)-binding protein [Hymenopellis radicata]
MSSQLVWFITGTSSGLGRDLALAALARGEKVIATGRARSLQQLDDLKEKGAATLELDVTAPLETLKSIAKKAVAIYGRVDVLVNNAGYILVGALEESTPEETLDQFNTNVFGALNVTRAFLPYMREKKSGTIVWMGSVGGWRAVPNAGLYGTSKWALRAISETLQIEVAPIGLRSICIDFGYFRTSFLTPDHRTPYEPKIEDYRPVTEAVEAALQAYNGNQPGNPKKGVEVVLDVIRGEGKAAGKTLPTSLLLGSDCLQMVRAETQRHADMQTEWEDVTKSTDF